MNTTAPNGSPLLARLAIDHGPADLLGRFFRHADAAAHALGVTLSFADMANLIEINEQNRDRATHAGRLFNLKLSNFYDLAHSLHLLYEHPNRSKRLGETCMVTAAAAQSIAGSVVFSGAAWYHLDYRGKGLSRIVPILSRAYAFTHWNVDYLVAMMSEGVVRGGMTERTGYTNIDWDIRVSNSPLGDVRFAFMWMEPRQLLQDVAKFVVRSERETPDALLQRRA
jgi:hypothetical protein